MARKKKDNYLTPDDLRVELEKLRDSVSPTVKYGLVSEKLGGYFLKLIDKIGSSGNFASYTYIEEMKGQGLEYLIKYSHNYKEKVTGKNKYTGEDKKSNPFSYCTQIAFCGFVQYIKKEQKIAKTKETLYEEIITDGGMLTMNVPNFQIEVESVVEKEIQHAFLLISDLIDEYYDTSAELRQYYNEKTRTKKKIEEITS